MFLILILLFTIVPMVEIYVLIELLSTIGLPATILIALGTGVLGVSLARQQGLATLGRIQQQLAAKQPPTDALIDGAMILLAGMVLIMPGVMTDLFGFALLVPPIRALLKPLLAAVFKSRVRSTNAGGPTVHVWSSIPRAEPNDPGTIGRGDDVIDAEVIDVRTKDAD